MQRIFLICKAYYLKFLKLTSYVSNEYILTAKRQRSWLQEAIDAMNFSHCLKQQKQIKREKQ